MNLAGGDIPEQVKAIHASHEVLPGVRRQASDGADVYSRGRQARRGEGHRYKRRPVEKAVRRRPGHHRPQRYLKRRAVHGCRRPRPYLRAGPARGCLAAPSTRPEQHQSGSLPLRYRPAQARGDDRAGQSPAEGSGRALPRSVPRIHGQKRERHGQTASGLSGREHADRTAGSGRRGSIRPADRVCECCEPPSGPSDWAAARNRHSLRYRRRARARDPAVTDRKHRPLDCRAASSASCWARLAFAACWR